VIVLTARTGVSDTVSGLEGGADDYVHKPFRFEELLARVRVRLRGERAPEETVLRVGNCALDLRTRRAQVAGRSVELTAREFAMAETFFRHPGQVLSREQLLSHVWGYDHDPGSNIVDVYVGYLRKKLGESRIVTVRGMGYRLSERRGAEDTTGEQSISGLRVLLVEDDARIAHIVARGLSEQGEVLVAEDGDVGLFLGTTEDFDAVILDMGLPGTSGLDVLRGIRAEHAHVPIIVVTGRDDPSVRQACLAAGATAFLTKPFSIEELRQVVRTSSRSGAASVR
jgi:DNA-binding response OmpR family regulator